MSQTTAWEIISTRPKHRRATRPSGTVQRNRSSHKLPLLWRGTWRKLTQPTEEA